MKRTAITLTLFLTALATGCPRYDAVRRLSFEQLSVQRELKESIDGYFKALDKLIDQQALSACILIDEESRDRIRNRKGQLDAALQSQANDEQARQAALDRYSAQVEDIVGFASTKKREIADRVVQIKAKHGEIVAAYQEMYDAQETLDRYVQLRKADEIVADDVAGRLRTSQEKVSSATRLAAEIASGLTDVIRQGRNLSRAEVQR